MAGRAFFSFHFERDVWRAGQVRNSWVTKDRESSGFFDAAAWEEVMKKTDAEIEKWIGTELNGTSVTVVLSRNVNTPICRLRNQAELQQGKWPAWHLYSQHEGCKQQDRYEGQQSL